MFQDGVTLKSLGSQVVVVSPCMVVGDCCHVGCHSHHCCRSVAASDASTFGRLSQRQSARCCLTVFPLFLPLAITAFGGPEGYFSLAIIAFGAFGFISPNAIIAKGKWTRGV